jgi:hypothetical protein
MIQELHNDYVLQQNMSEVLVNMYTIVVGEIGETGEKLTRFSRTNPWLN